jgi:hypothetical protein
LIGKCGSFYLLLNLWLFSCKLRSGLKNGDQMIKYSVFCDYDFNKNARTITSISLKFESFTKHKIIKNWQLYKRR